MGEELTGRVLDLAAGVAREMIFVSGQVEQVAAPRAKHERADLVRGRRGGVHLPVRRERRCAGGTDVSLSPHARKLFEAENHKSDFTKISTCGGPGRHGRESD